MKTPKPSSAQGGERIAKVMARAGLCSRRAAEEWIAAGRVSVNGETIASPALNVGPRDRIAVDGKPMPTAERTRLFLYNKPRGLVTTNADPERRPTIFGALPRNLPRLISVGRLDLNTEGLLLLTNDGGLARVLELPQTGWLRRYRARAHGSITQEALNGLRQGITVDGVRYGSIEAALDRTQGANVWLTFAMREGKNREIRNVLEHLGLSVNRLIRVSYGPFQLGELPDGGIEEVKTRVLREQLGERIAEAAGADFSGSIVIRDEPEPVRPRKPVAAPTSEPDERQPRAGHPGRAPTTEGEAPRAPRRGFKAQRPVPTLSTSRPRDEGVRRGAPPRRGPAEPDDRRSDAKHAKSARNDAQRPSRRAAVRRHARAAEKDQAGAATAPNLSGDTEPQRKLPRAAAKREKLRKPPPDRRGGRRPKR